MKKPWEEEKNLSIKERFKERRKLLKPFIKKYGKPVLVHSTYNSDVFKRILGEGKLKIPSKHKSPKLSPYWEELIGIHNTIYYSLGFVYQTAYDWKYAFIFDLKYLRDLIYYENAVGCTVYGTLLYIWYEYDRNYFEKVANTNKLTREVFDKYLYDVQEGKRTKKLEFWKIEKTLFDSFMKYSGKEDIIKIINREVGKLLKKYPYSSRLARKDWKTRKVPEIVGKEDNDIRKNEHFLGFYIKGKIPKDIKKILLEKYPDKILYDGNKITKIREVLK